MSVNIIKADLTFRELAYFNQEPTHLILHHAVANCDVETIHDYHLSLGWRGIAYHFYVRKDGSIYQGRPLNAIGGHTSGYHHNSIGICFEGNFEVEHMPAAQMLAGRNLVEYVKGVYPSITTFGPHRDFNATACPGKYCPVSDILTSPEPTDPNKPPEWATDIWAEGKALGLTDGTRPNDAPTRAELIAVAVRLYNLLK